jgi:hypothetical protein
MANLYTKNGRPLQRSGDAVYSRSGKYVGRVSGDKLYGANGRYVATIVGDRAVYRSTDSARISSAHAPRVGRVGSAAASRAGSAMWGQEPDIPD